MNHAMHNRSRDHVMLPPIAQLGATVVLLMALCTTTGSSTHRKMLMGFEMCNERISH